MTNEQILKKATEKAEKNGFDLKKLPCMKGRSISKITISRHGISTVTCQGNSKIACRFETVIFSHEFAEAFAKYILKERNEMIPQRIDTVYTKEKIRYIKNWFLGEMVLEKEPLKYIKKFL